MLSGTGAWACGYMYVSMLGTKLIHVNKVALKSAYLIATPRLKNKAYERIDSSSHDIQVTDTHLDIGCRLLATIGVDLQMRCNDLNKMIGY